MFLFHWTLNIIDSLANTGSLKQRMKNHIHKVNCNMISLKK